MAQGLQQDGARRGRGHADPPAPDGTCGAAARPLFPGEIVEADASLVDVILVLTRHEHCFVSVLGQVSGIQMKEALPGANAFLFLGFRRLDVPFDEGRLLVDPALILFVPTPVAGDGTLTLQALLPATVTRGREHMQQVRLQRMASLSSELKDQIQRVAQWHKDRLAHIEAERQKYTSAGKPVPGAKRKALERDVDPRPRK